MLTEGGEGEGDRHGGGLRWRAKKGALTSLVKALPLCHIRIETPVYQSALCSFICIRGFKAISEGFFSWVH